MKLRRLKRIRIGEVIFTVKWDSKDDGGYFDYGEKTISIGIKGNTMRQFAVIVHEIKEILNINQYVRYTRPDTLKDYEFHYGHREHSAMCNDLAGILNEFIK
ncbi:MAG TPA: hypothetical protein DCZ94_21720 [Lentisphaeria bacterium]|nr:MAG: hypothetical protein A2X48_14650 [Lentisphaerae bacterium GWF2_49_21]HBC89565.1 hypothetical protein [Lentisphaeria bacterium]